MKSNVHRPYPHGYYPQHVSHWKSLLSYSSIVVALLIGFCAGRLPAKWRYDNSDFNKVVNLSKFPQQATITITPSVPVTGSDVIDELTKKATPTGMSTPIWYPWTRLNGNPIKVESSIVSLQAAATRTDFGFSLIVSNTSKSKVDIKLNAGLSPGTYILEKQNYLQTFDLLESTPERLESIFVDSSTMVSRTIWINPESVLVVKVLNLTEACKSSLSSLWTESKSDFDGHSDTWKKIRGPLNDCINQISALAERNTDRVKSRKRIQSALLSFSQAEAKYVNFLRNAGLSSKASSDLRSSVLEVQTRLNDLSFACFNIIPKVTLTGVDADKHEKQYDVILLNAGENSIQNVKIGCDPREGIEVIPSDDAVFGSVGLSEKVSLSLVVRESENAPKEPIRFKFSYFALKTPVRFSLIRPK